MKPSRAPWPLRLFTVAAAFGCAGLAVLAELAHAVAHRHLGCGPCPRCWERA